MAVVFEKLKIPELVKITGDVHTDQRGYFTEVFKQSDFFEQGIKDNFCQDNFSFSQKNVLRGLHYQLAPKPQSKLIRVLEGKIWDVAVDIRSSSPTFKQWLAVEISEQNAVSLYIPAGFAHGFVVLSETARVLYKTTAEYEPDLERGIIWNDSTLNIQWPVKIPLVSKKDQTLPNFTEAEIFE